MINFADEPTLKDYMKSMKRGWWLIAGCLAIALVFGLGKAFLTTPLYKASAVVMADTSTTNTKDYVDRVTVPEVTRVMEALATDALSTTSLARMATELGLFAGAPSAEARAAEMRKAITTEVTGFDTFAVTFTADDPVAAMTAANRVAEEFLAVQKTYREKNGDATNGVLSKELDALGADLKKKDAAMKKFRIENFGSLPDQTEGHMRAIERWQGDLRLNTLALQRARERLTLALNSTPKIYQGEAIEVVRAEIAGLQAERAEIKKLIASAQRYLSKAGDVEGRMAEMQREHSSTLIAYNDLMKRRQEAALKVGLDRSRFDMLFKIVEPAKQPIAPFKPMRLLILGIALAAGLLLGAGLAVTRDYFDETFHEPAELSRHTGLPVLAAVPHQGRLLRP